MTSSFVHFAAGHLLVSDFYKLMTIARVVSTSWADRLRGTREYGERDVKTALAQPRGAAPADLHCYEPDATTRFLETMAAETIRLRLQGSCGQPHQAPALLPQATPSSHRSSAPGPARGTNPSKLGAAGPLRPYPIRRGFTRVRAARAGVNVAIVNDSIMYPCYPLGVGDPVHSCFLMVILPYVLNEDSIASRLRPLGRARSGRRRDGLSEGRRGPRLLRRATPIDVGRSCPAPGRHLARPPRRRTAPRIPPGLSTGKTRP